MTCPEYERPCRSRSYHVFCSHVPTHSRFIHFESFFFLPGRKRRCSLQGTQWSSSLFFFRKRASSRRQRTTIRKVDESSTKLGSIVLSSEYPWSSSLQRMWLDFIHIGPVDKDIRRDVSLSGAIQVHWGPSAPIQSMPIADGEGRWTWSARLKIHLTIGRSFWCFRMTPKQATDWSVLFVWLSSCLMASKCSSWRDVIQLTSSKDKHCVAAKKVGNNSASPTWRQHVIGPRTRSKWQQLQNKDHKLNMRLILVPSICKNSATGLNILLNKSFFDLDLSLLMMAARWTYQLSQSLLLLLSLPCGLYSTSPLSPFSIFYDRSDCKNFSLRLLVRSSLSLLPLRRKTKGKKEERCCHWRARRTSFGCRSRISRKWRRSIDQRSSEIIVRVVHWNQFQWNFFPLFSSSLNGIR